MSEKTLIPIDRSSVRRNPTAGRTTYYIAAGPEEVVEVYRNGVLISRTTTQPMNTVHSLTPEPAFLYKYEDPVLECNCCEERRQLSSYTEEWTDDGYYLGYCCNGCGVEHAVDVKHEELDNETLSKLAEENEAMNAP